MSTEPRLPRELEERGMMPPGQPPSPPISKDDWWQLRKELQEFQAEERGRREKESRLRAQYDRQLTLWRWGVTLLVGSTTALLGILLTFLLTR